MKRISKLLVLSFVFIFSACSDEESVEKDEISPTIVCQADITIDVDQFISKAIVEYEAPIGQDNLEGITTTQTSGLASGKSFPVGITTNTFEVKDAAGNKASCSFNVTVIQATPSSNLPYVINSNPAPVGGKWTKVEELSDEFDGTTLDSKWDTRSEVPGKFNWVGRFPGLFQPENISVIEGELRMEAKKETVDKHDKVWTHTGAIIRSNALIKRGMYTEAKMKTTTTIMSGTFWMQSPASSDCIAQPKLELDVTESIGRSSGKFKIVSGEPTPAWYSTARADFLQGMNATVRQRADNCTPQTINRGTPTDKGGTFSPSGDFHVYGFYWEDVTQLHFYVDGEYSHSIVPSIPFDNPMALIMAIEVYDFNWPNDADTDGFNESKVDRSTRYEWVRTWQLEDE